MSDDGDQAWLDLLAGRAAPGADPALAREAALLRDGLHRYRIDAPPGHVPAPDERVQRLLDRAHQSGVLPGAERATAPPPPAPRRSTALAAPRWWPAAVLGLGLATGLAWWSQRPGPAQDTLPFVLRGDGVLQRPAPDLAQARAQRDALLSQLRAQGFEADAYEQLDRPGVDLALTQPLSDARRAALLALGITPPHGPQLRVEFVPVNP